MERINWIIIRSKGRGIDYGVGTFVNNMLFGLNSFPYIDIYVIEIGANNRDEFSIVNKEGVTYFNFKKAWHSMTKDTVSNQRKHARNTVRVLQQFIPNDRKTIVHMNFIFQYFMGEEFKNTYNAFIIATQHVFTEEFDEKLYDFDLEKQTYKLVDKFITVTNHGKEYLCSRVNNNEKITTIYNGINPLLFNDADADVDYDSIIAKYGISSHERFVLYSGRLDPIKGLKYLTGSFKIVLQQIPDCRLVIAGDGDYDELIQKSREFSSNINFLGFIPFQDLIEFYKKATIGVIPSLEEHCSYVALEMLHCGLPVVATRVGGLKEIFVHGENALLVETIPDYSNVFGIAPDVRLMGEYMITLLKDKVLRKKISINGKKRAMLEFTSFQMVQKYLNLTLNNFKA